VQRGSAELARAFRDSVGHGEKLIAVLIEEQVVIAKTSHLLGLKLVLCNLKRLSLA
jgi:hypothetical protein